MDPILQAVRRAKSGARQALVTPPPPAASRFEPTNVGVPSGPITGPDVAPASPGWLKEVELSWEHLERQRIVAHNVSDFRSRAYDVLRTQMLQSMDRKKWHFLAVTSPTEGCGKTVTSINLALSIARQPERSVVLIDLDLQRPKLARYLGLNADRGAVSVLSGRSKLRESMLKVQIGGYFCTVLPAETRTLHSSELIASRAMRSMLQEIKDSFPDSVMIVDLPPVMSGDDVLSVMPYVDGFLLIAAVGRSTVSDVRESAKYLQSAELLRIVLNKSSDPQSNYGQRATI